MNNDRRKLEEITEQLEELKSRIEPLHDEEQESFDNLPEGFQQGEKGQNMEAAIDQLDTAVGGVEEAVDAINDAVTAGEESMMHKILFATLILVTFAVAQAAEVLEVSIVNPPEFRYETATIASPLIVDARTKGGNCKLRLALVGLQGGVGKDGGTITGRVESGTCDGKSLISKTIVSGFAVASGEKVKLLPGASVVVLTP